MEFKPKKRDWVKNASIIFLSVLLVLTFFSNTWMNRSLPEVATQYVTNGTITAKVRGSGTVSAVGVTSVKAEQTREIRAVMVKVGQEVKAGDVLFVLGQGEASELESAQEALRQLQLSYQKTAVGIIYPSYAGDERRIQDAKEEMDAAKAALDKIAKGSGKTESELINKQTIVSERLEEATKVRDAERQAYDELINAAKEVLAEKAQLRDDAQRALTQNGITFLDRWRFKDANGHLVILDENGNVQQITQLSSGLAATVITVYPDEYDSSVASLFGAAEGLEDPSGEEPAAPSENGDSKAADDPSPTATPNDPAPTAPPVDTAPPASQDDPEPSTASDTPAPTAPSDNPSPTVPPADPSPTIAPDDPSQVKPEDIELMKEFQKRQQEVDFEQKLLEDIPRTNLDAAQATVDALQKDYDDIQAQIDAIAAAGSSSEAYTKARAAYKAAREEYLSLVDALEERKASDARSQSLSYLDLADLNVQIEKAKEKVKELSGGEENQVVAKTAGTIETIDCAPGDTKLKGDLLCTIEVPDLGYTMSFSVTNDQARRLKPGDTATVSNYYWGREITATLSTIRVDPKDPQNKKLLTFDISGDVSAGAELTVSIGQRSANYDWVVPKSALHSDSGGSFIYKVESKNSPLGNRYIARRVNVEILAQDDTSVAVTGDLGWGDYVITTSSAPVKNGDMVRLADN